MAWDIALYLDEGAERRIAAVQRSFARRFVVPPRPHLTLGVFHEGRYEAGLDIVAQWAKETPPLEIEFVLYGTDCRAGSVLLLPAANAGLIAAHAGLSKMLCARGIEAEPHYRPGRWLPHCTLIKGVAASIIEGLREACAGANLFGSALCDKAAVLRYEHFEEIGAFKLRGTAKKPFEAEPFLIKEECDGLNQ